MRNLIHIFCISLEKFTEKLGLVISWFTVLMVVIMTAVVILRYGFNLGWIGMQESIVYLHACVFMLGCGYALKHNSHVRVDVFYRKLPPKRQAIIDFFGCLLLLMPTLGFIFWASFDYVEQSWLLSEGSIEAGGLPFVYLLKTLLLLMPLTLFLQAIVMLLRAAITVFPAFLAPHPKEF